MIKTETPEGEKIQSVHGRPTGIGRPRIRRGLVHTAVAAGLTAAFSLALPAASQAEQALPSPGDPAWKPLLFPNIEQTTQFEITEDPAGRPAFRAVSDCGASAMSVALPKDLSPTQTPRIAWRWRIEESLDIAQEKTKRGDDFAARVYVLFPFEPDRAGPFERLQRKLGKKIFGVSMPGKSLNYVFASRQRPGDTWSSPYHDDARLIAVASAQPSGESGETDPSGWSEVIVDWTADAERHFSPVPSALPYALAVMVDADTSCDRAVAWFSDFRLLGPAPDPSAGHETESKKEAARQ